MFQNNYTAEQANCISLLVGFQPDNVRLFLDLHQSVSITKKEMFYWSMDKLLNKDFVPCCSNDTSTFLLYEKCSEFIGRILQKYYGLPMDNLLTYVILHGYHYSHIDTVKKPNNYQEALRDILYEAVYLNVISIFGESTEGNERFAKVMANIFISVYKKKPKTLKRFLKKLEEIFKNNLEELKEIYKEVCLKYKLVNEVYENYDYAYLDYFTFDSDFIDEYIPDVNLQKSLFDKLLPIGYEFYKKVYSDSDKVKKCLLFSKYERPSYILDILYAIKYGESIKLFE